MTFINRGKHNNAIKGDALIQYGAVKQRTDKHGAVHPTILLTWRIRQYITYRYY